MSGQDANELKVNMGETQANRPELRQILAEGAAQLGVELNDQMTDAYMEYMRLLLEWNEKVNLTSITDEKEIIIKHFLDSISIIPHIPFVSAHAGAGVSKANTTRDFMQANNSASLADIGTGAGFPGIAVKIAQGCGNLLLLDSLEKRIKFLERTISELSLESSEAVHSRAEDAGHSPMFREAYDCTVARAVASLNVLLEYCLPFVKPGGVFIAMKGPDPIQECNEAKKALSILGGEISNVVEFKLPFSEMQRSLIIVKKIRQTSTMYPRKAGKPSKFPLI